MSASPTTLVGNITQDPELKISANGTAKLAFSIACNHFWTDQSGEKQEKTSFFNVVAWRNLAEEAANVLEKGVRVVVMGRLEQRTYQDKEGQNRSVVELVADDVAISARSLESITRRRSGGDNAGQSRPRIPTKGRAAAQPKIQLEADEPF
jgi:single-strand DNA-binding protein